jgi:hypothetical protein
VLSIRRFLEMQPFRNTKNFFPPEKEHGREAAYGFYSVYSLLAASQLGIAYMVADEKIQESNVPQQTCSCVISLPGAFHKVFASCADYHLELDTDPYSMYDATGLGRIHRRGFPSELGLSTSIVSHGNFLPLPPASERDICIGPGWTDKQGNKYWLSDFWEQIKKRELKILEENTRKVEFAVSYVMKNNKWGCHKITEKYLLTAEGLIISSAIEGNVAGTLFQVPLLESNGKDKTAVNGSVSSFKVSLNKAYFNVECMTEKVEAYMETFTASNRNGIYNVGCFQTCSNRINIKLSFNK